MMSEDIYCSMSNKECINKINKKRTKLQLYDIDVTRTGQRAQTERQSGDFAFQRFVAVYHKWCEWHNTYSGTCTLMQTL